MKALTLHQPWAWAVCHAGKRIENRGWPPPAWMIGRRLALHAGKTFEKGVVLPGADKPVTPDEILPLGAVVAVVTVADCLTEPRSGIQALWWVGPYGWCLTDVEVLPSPVPCRGQQGLWNLDPETEAEVSHQLGKSDGRKP